MKISKINLKNYKRFSDLTIQNIPKTAKLILVVGPNGSGKTSLFDAFNLWYRQHSRFGFQNDTLFYIKEPQSYNWDSLVSIEFHDHQVDYGDLQKGKFYFRTAYRNQADFSIQRLEKQYDPMSSSKINFLIQNDETVSENYQRLISHTLSGVYNPANDSKSILQFREELIGRIRDSLKNVFEDSTLTSIGDPLSNGSFYFEKGTSKNFHYKNLSGGEKSVFDIVLDLIIKSSYFQEAIFCIDEPEAHMHTSLQAKLLNEVFQLIPDNSQLWLNTHSFGMLKKARELEQKFPGSVAFISFDNLDFDNKVTIEPKEVDKTIWSKFLEIALDDFSTLIAPKRIVFCEGTPNGRKYKNFDAQIFTIVFSDKYPETSFVSIGSCSELENPDNITMKILKQILAKSSMLKIVDRDDKNTREIKELNNLGIKVLNRRHIESYILDDEIIIKLCTILGMSNKITDCITMKNTMLANSVARGNPNDDIKSASGDIFVELKRILQLTQCGNTKDAFFRDIMAPLITNDTQIYKELETEILK